MTTVNSTTNNIRILINNLKAQGIYEKWWLVDAKDQVLGRMATRVASLLTGKYKPLKDKSCDCGDNVVVINARDVYLSGKKRDQKIYYRYSGYPGGLKKKPAKVMLERKPEEVIRHAVMGMVPKNKLRYLWQEKLWVYAAEQHPHADKGLLVAEMPFKHVEEAEDMSWLDEYIAQHNAEEAEELARLAAAGPR
mmetsp:Transcript_27275/g.47067  ORF Transcript_27275/g.47067 Transcript_27275/m.47067 type:complete len:193 (-) Transcript_27275:22-600(-)